MTKEKGLEQVCSLIQQFTDRGQEVTHTDYLEAQVRTQFLDRFFAALGWDVSNHKEATVEKSQAREDGSKKRADYAFHVTGKEFFVEAKKPSENLDAMQQQAMAQETARRSELEKQRIETALRRLDDGEYGLCVRCEEEIDERRLAIDPATLVCIDCARKAEQRNA